MRTIPLWRNVFPPATRPSRAHVGPLSLVAITALATLRPLLAGTWPSNHDENAFLVRTLIFAEHLREGDWLPVWSSADALGYGSAEPALYHKLFYLVSGSIMRVTASANLAVVIAIWLFMMLGAVGQYYLVLKLTHSRSVAFAGSLMLLLANYTVTNWMVRGALAEFSAAMLIPAILTLSLSALERGRAAILLGVVVGLLILAHSVLALYLVGMLSIAALLTRAASTTAFVSWRQLATRASFALAIALLTSGPYLMAMAALGRGYDLRRMTLGQFAPAYNFASPRAYVLGTGFEFGRHWQQISLELDRPPLLWLVLAAVLTLLTRRWPNATSQSQITPSQPAPTAVPMRSAVTFLGIVLTICVVLQLPASAWFYTAIPGAAYLQFPWRLLAISTPILIALSLAALRTANLRPVALRVALIAGVALACVNCGAFRSIDYPQSSVSEQTLAASLPVDLSLLREYYPADVQWQGLAATAVLQRAATLGCQVTAVSRSPEALVHVYRYDCTAPASIALPEVWSAAHMVSLQSTGDDVHEIRSRRSTQGLIELTVPRGRGSIDIRVPTMASAVRAFAMMVSGHTP